jgi:hypothetical protein
MVPIFGPAPYICLSPTLRLALLSTGPDTSAQATAKPPLTSTTTPVHADAATALAEPAIDTNLTLPKVLETQPKVGRHRASDRTAQPTLSPLALLALNAARPRREAYAT